MEIHTFPTDRFGDSTPQPAATVVNGGSDGERSMVNAADK